MTFCLFFTPEAGGKDPAVPGSYIRLGPTSTGGAAAGAWPAVDGKDGLALHTDGRTAMLARGDHALAGHADRKRRITDGDRTVDVASGAFELETAGKTDVTIAKKQFRLHSHGTITVKAQGKLSHKGNLIETVTIGARFKHTNVSIATHSGRRFDYYRSSSNYLSLLTVSTTVAKNSATGVKGKATAVSIGGTAIKISRTSFGQKVGFLDLKFAIMYYKKLATFEEGGFVKITPDAKADKDDEAANLFQAIVLLRKKDVKVSLSGLNSLLP